MLVLTRKRTEMIKIGEDIVITVIHTSKGTVKLGIEAPANVRVLRAELDNRPATTRAASVSPSAIESSDELDLPELPMFSADRFLNDFDADYLAEVEDQALLCMAE